MGEHDGGAAGGGGASDGAPGAPAPRLDFPFTVHDTPALRRRVTADLTHVCRTVTRHDPACEAIILTGGFSRGEGSARGDRPLNDYDLVVARRADRPRPGLYDDLAHRLEERLGLHMDLLPIWRRRLPHVGAKIFWYETRAAGRVIHGPPGVLDAIPVERAADIPLDEAVRLLFNRAAGLLEPTAPDAAGDGELVRVQSSKAVLASVEALLLLHGRYHHSYRERLHRFTSLLPDLDGAVAPADALARRAELATRYKLQPDLAPIRDGATFWREARETLLATLAHVTAATHGGLDAYLQDAGTLAEAAVYNANAARHRDARLLADRPSLRAREATLALLEAAELPTNGADAPERAAAALAPMFRDGAPEGFHGARERLFQARALTLQ